VLPSKKKYKFYLIGELKNVLFTTFNIFSLLQKVGEVGKVGKANHRLPLDLSYGRENKYLCGTLAFHTARPYYKPRGFIHGNNPKSKIQNLKSSDTLNSPDLHTKVVSGKNRGWKACPSIAACG
jgi:hypothetical protein